MIIKEVNNNSGIYTITNIIDNKIYIGYCTSFYDRSMGHKSQLKYNKHGNVHLQRAWNKYGEFAFIFEILEECPIELLASQENYWCNMLNVHNDKYGYNIQPTHPDNRPVTSLETKERIRNSKLGTKASVETKKKQSDSHKKRLFGKVHILTGRKTPKERIIRIANSRKKIVIQMDLQGNFIREWDSAKDGGIGLNLDDSSIGKCCKGNKRNSRVGGFKWKYKL